MNDPTTPELDLTALPRRSFLAGLIAAPLGVHALGACGEGTPRPGLPADTATADTHDVSESAGPDTAAPDATDTASPDTVPPTACEATTPDIQGPFFQADAPAVTELAPAGEPGDPIALSGHVLDLACQPIPGARLEVWQADAAGHYHDHKLRATLTAAQDGGYAFVSVMPGRYLQAAGPRPAHIHFTVSAPGFRSITTQLYFAGDPFVQPNDSCSFCASDDPDRIIPLTDDPASGRQTGTWDVVLRPA